MVSLGRSELLPIKGFISWKVSAKCGVPPIYLSIYLSAYHLFLTSFTECVSYLSIFNTYLRNE